jgi:uncharacterized membrane protein YdbT with pleckstrin-like domain
MIVLNEEQHLGGKAFIIFFLRKTALAWLFLILLIIALPIRDGVMNWLNTSLSTALVSDTTINSVSSSFSLVISILFFLTIVFFIGGFIVSYLQYRTYTFTFEEFDLKMRRGILNRKENSVPYRQIQDVDTEQSIFFQMLGLSKVIIMTAGHEESDEHEKTEIILEPVDRDTAEEIRSKLEREIGVQVVEDEKEADKEAA